jgi:hypothetical protein
MLSDRSARNKQARISSIKNSGNNYDINSKPLYSVEETKRKIEKQLNESTKKGYKPAPNAVPVSFVPSSTKTKVQV